MDLLTVGKRRRLVKQRPARSYVHTSGSVSSTGGELARGVEDVAGRREQREQEP